MPVMRKNKMASFGLAAIMGVVSACSATAEELVQAPQTTLVAPVATRAFPGTFGIPSAVAPRSGSAFVGATYANPRGGVSGAGGDGDIVAGYAIGNPLDAVSLTFGLAITGVEPLGDSGSFSLSASRLLRAGGRSATFAGFSASNLLAWGDSAGRAGMFSAYVSYLVGVETATVEIPLLITVGIGTDNTRETDGSGILRDGVFAGMGIGLTENLSAGLSTTLTQQNVGATLTVPGTGLSVTLGVLDILDNTQRRQVSLSAAYSL